jgi:uncharacterized protein YqfA (UPF0365 family)
LWRRIFEAFLKKGAAMDLVSMMLAQVDRGPSAMTIFGFVLLIIGLIILIIGFVVIGSFFSIWLRAYSAKANVTFFNLIGMKLRKVDTAQIVQYKITASQAGLADVTTEMLESHYLAGGRVPNVVRAMIAAHRAQIPLDWFKGAAIDLAGRDVLDAVQTSVNPKVIDVPNAQSGRATIDGVAKDGIQLKVKARVTVRTNIQQLIGGATEETVIARVGEGIVTAIGSADTYKHVMENPDSISKTVLHKGLDAGTAFEILSIDIADVDVGENIGAKLQADQAESDKRRFQAEAEKRRALAVAQEQEFKATAQQNRAKVIEAEAQIPLAMAEAFRKGNLGIMDYYKMRNVMADTGMRESLGGSGQTDDK